MEWFSLCARVDSNEKLMNFGQNKSCNQQIDYGKIGVLTFCVLIIRSATIVGLMYTTKNSEHLAFYLINISTLF